MGPTGQHKGEWTDNACLATQLRLRHGLLWNLVVSLAELNFGCRLDRNGVHGDGVVALSHRRACAGVCAFLRWAWCALDSCPVHARYVHPRMFLTSPYISEAQSLQGDVWNTITAGCAHVLVCSQFVHSRWGRGGNYFMQSTCCLAWVWIFDRRRDESIVLRLSIFDASGCVCVCMCVCVCVYAHTHTHCTCNARCQPRGRDKTLGGPGECRYNKCWQTCIHICVQSTHVYIYTVRRYEIYTICLVSSKYVSFRKSKSKDVIIKHQHLKSTDSSK